MKWTFTVLDQPHTAEWKVGAMRCSFPRVVEIVDELIAGKEIVMSGSAASLVTASLATEASGWATIHAAVMSVADFESVTPPVNMAGEIDDVIYEEDAIDKARERQFSSRSEAGRYAAQIRWGNRHGGGDAAEQALRAQEDAEIAQLQTAAKEAMDKMLQVQGAPDNDAFVKLLDRRDSDGIDECKTQEDYEQAVGPAVRVTLVSGRSSAVVPSQDVAAAEVAKQALGERVYAIAERRTAKARAEWEANGGRSQDDLRAEIGTLNIREATLMKDIKRSKDDETTHRGVPSMLAEDKKRTAEFEARLATVKAEREALWQKWESHPDELMRQEAVRILHKFAPTGQEPNMGDSGQIGLAQPYRALIGSTYPRSIVGRDNGTVITTQGTTYFGWHKDLTHGQGQINIRPELTKPSKDGDDRVREANLRSTMVHEYGHQVQITIPAVRLFDGAYLARRMTRSNNDSFNMDATNVRFWQGFVNGSKDAYTKGALPKHVKDGLKGAPLYAGGRYPPSPVASNRNLYSVTEAFTVGTEMVFTFGNQWGFEKDLAAHAIGTMLTVA